MNKKNMKINALVLVCGALLLTGCTRSLSHPDSQGKTAQPVFPELESAVRTEGSYPDVISLEKVRPGMTKAQIYELLGVPHFKEGALRVKEWDYIFHFPIAEGKEVTCQYKVLYDHNLEVGSTYFKPENCLSLLKPAESKIMSRELSAEALFDFSSARLSKKGEEVVRSLVTDIRQSDQVIRHITVTGHTDRIGPAISNQRLSQARAESVKQLMIQNGISPSVITIRGMGESMPLVQCEGATSPSVIACLAANRRITVDVQLTK